MLPQLSNEIRRNEGLYSGDYTPLNEGCEAHWEVVERMLFLYAKLNPGQGYVQGMNEIIGPIYHTFASDSDKEFRSKYTSILIDFHWTCVTLIDWTVN